MSKDLFSLSSYHYELPEELIAQYPCTPRDHSRLMIVNRVSGEISEIKFRDILTLLNPCDNLIFNDTKVVPSRLIGKRKGGGEAEIFLTQRHADGTWDALARPGRKLPPGSFVTFSSSFSCEILERLSDGGRRIRFHGKEEIGALLEKWAQVPLPRYIKRTPEEMDKDRYQTVYAQKPGAYAAPTAGLHFTNELLHALNERNVSQTKITLHVGLGTFRPIKTEDIRHHQMHSERCHISEEAAVKLNQRGTFKQICVGTTCCRTLESAAKSDGEIVPGEYDTSIFIYPGYQFKYVTSLLTNFHLPGSSLLMLVSAFAGYDLMREAYAKAVKDRYRFFSYGDAMLII